LDPEKNFVKKRAHKINARAKSHADVSRVFRVAIEKTFVWWSGGGVKKSRKESLQRPWKKDKMCGGWGWSPSDRGSRNDWEVGSLLRGNGKAKGEVKMKTIKIIKRRTATSNQPPFSKSKIQKTRLITGEEQAKGANSLPSAQPWKKDHRGSITNQRNVLGK